MKTLLLISALFFITGLTTTLLVGCKSRTIFQVECEEGYYSGNDADFATTGEDGTYIRFDNVKQINYSPTIKCSVTRWVR